jgi:hypothetical protein
MGTTVRITVGILSLLSLIWLSLAPAGAASAATASHARHLPATIGPVHGKHRVGTVRLAGGARATTFTSQSWAGYASTPQSGGAPFTEVQAQWVQPAVSCDPSQPVMNAVFWVGLDGWTDNSVEQGGTLANCQNGTASYEAWWEMFPFNGLVTTFAINAGDTISASVTYQASTGLFNIVVTDLTSGQSFTESITCQADMGGCPRSSAEVISEDPGGGADQDGRFFLPDYGTATYTAASMSDDNGDTGSFTDTAWNTSEIDQVSSNNITKQTTGPLTDDGSSFSTTWVAESGNSGTLPEAEASYMTGNTAPSTNEIQPNIDVANVGNVPLQLSSLTIRYWFTEDSSAPLAYACDYAPLGCSNVTGSFGVVSPAVTGADHYLQIGFTSGAGSIQPGQSTGIMQNRFWNTAFTDMTQTNDYSFNASDTTLALNPAITVYYNGSLIDGTPPS